MANYIGIDLGTTETTVSAIQVNRKDKPLEKLNTLDIYQYNSSHEFDRNIKKLQSSIYIDRDKNKVYTGEYAKTIYSNGSRPLNTIRSIKTRIGGESMIDIPLERDNLNLKSYDMTELSSLFLKTVKNSVERQIGTDISHTTITIPAGFNSDERKATIESAKLAGFDNINLLDEPTAVLLNYLNYDNELSFQKKKNIVVYDIGGGTLDISIAQVKDKDGDFDVNILGRSKRVDFGGDDIDKYIVSYFLSEFEKINTPIENRTIEEQSIIVSRIVSQAEKIKISFNNEISKHIDNPRRRARAKESVNFEIIDNLKVIDLTITDEILKDILSKVISEEGTLLKPLKYSLKESKLNKEDIDLVILTGGSGKLYLIEESLRTFFPRTEIIDFTSYNAVSVGAVIHSYNQDKEDLKKVNIDDIMSDSIFIKQGDKLDLLIDSNQETNTKGKYIYKFTQTLDRLEVFLYYGSKNEERYKYKEISGIFKNLNNTYKKGEIIELDWEFDINKTIKISFEGVELINSKISVSEKKECDILDSFSLN